MIGSRSFLALSVACIAALGVACSNPDVAKRRYLESGNKLMAEHKPQQAIAQYRSALRSDPRFGEARRHLADAYVEVGNPQAAFREYVRAADLLPNDDDVQVKAANFLLVAGRYEDAKARAVRVLERNPRNVDALIVKANATAGLKDVKTAIHDLEEATAGPTPDARVLTTLGSLELVSGQRADAEATYKKAIEIDTKSVGARVALANFYLASARPADAESMLSEALAIDSGNLQANRLLAYVYLATRRTEQAEQPLKALSRGTDPQSRFALADYYMTTGKPQAALPILKGLADQPATHADATVRIAVIDYAAGRQTEAMAALDQLLAKQPRYTRALALKARWQLAAGKVDAAAETARVATKADPASADSQYVLGTVLSTKRNNVEAIAALNESLRLNPRFVPAQLLLSRLKLATGDVVGAVKSAQEAKKNAPANPDAQLALARSLIAQRNITEAQTEVGALLAKYPQRAEPQALNGFILLQKKQTAEARAAFERALKLDPDYPEAYEGLLSLDFRANRTADAVKRIDARVAQNPNNPTLLIVSARTYAAARQPEKSESALRRVIELDPNNMPAYVLLAQSYIAQKKIDQAVAQYDEVSKRTQNVSASTMAALLVQLQRRDDEALKRYEAIVAANQGAPVAANNLAWIYAEKGINLNMALQLAQQAKSQLPNSPDVSDTLGWVYIKKGLPQLAIGLLEESVAKVPDNASFRYHLGLAYAQAGQKDKARAALERALQLSPRFEGANSARETLASL